MRTVNTLVLYLIFVGRSIMPIAHNASTATSTKIAFFFTVPAGYWPACIVIFCSVRSNLCVSRCRINVKGVSNRTGNIIIILISQPYGCPFEERSFLLEMAHKINLCVLSYQKLINIKRAKIVSPHPLPTDFL